MEGVVMPRGVRADFWSRRRVLVLGHTGFKGSWLSLWLQSMGAEVHGLALAPPTEPSMFAVANVAAGLASSTTADIRNADRVGAIVSEVQPEVVLHLAAQPIVRTSYRQPVETFAVNVMGLVNVLEAVRGARATKAVVNVTSDKCYENRERSRPYHEDDPMGGHDPYSCSKGCAELVTAAYRRSFLADAGVATATARAGNVIGGGDWAPDRLVPDVFRAADAGEAVTIRFPDAVRPWQHVLEPLSGYLMLAERLCENGAEYAQAWNFGPAAEDERSVRWVVEQISAHREGMVWNCHTAAQPHEAGALTLDSTKARRRLEWRPRWSLEVALERTIEWHDAWARGQDMHAMTNRQIKEYSAGDV